MVRALTLAIGDLRDRAVARLLLRSLLMTLALFVVLGAALLWLLRGADPCGLVGLDGCPLDTATGGIGAAMLTLAALWLLFPAVAMGVIAADGDAIVAAVERRHYPDAALTAHRQGIGAAMLRGLTGALRVLLYNLVALPLYLVLLVTGVGTLALFIIVNGLALAADLGAMVAVRHGDRAARRAWLRATRIERGLIGAAVTAMFMVPVLNLVAPVIGAAATTHLRHRR